jgi:hypothetical protein
MFQGYIDQDTATPAQATAVPDALFERGLYWASGRSGVVSLVAAHKWFCGGEGARRGKRHAARGLPIDERYRNRLGAARGARLVDGSIRAASAPWPKREKLSHHLSTVTYGKYTRG